MVSYSHRIFMYGPMAALATAAFGYSLYWYYSARNLEAALDAANGHAVMPGVVFAFSEKSIGGFPFRLDAVLSGVAFTHIGIEGETAWRSEKLAIHKMSYSGNQYLFEAAGLQSVTWPEGRLQRVYYITPALLRASAIMRNTLLERFDLDVTEANAHDAFSANSTERVFHADRAQLHMRVLPSLDLEVAAKAQGVRIGRDFSPVFGQEMPIIQFDALVSHGTVLRQLRAGKTAFADASEAWRLAGGTFQITNFSSKWGPVKFDATGLLYFDQGHRVAGSINGALNTERDLGKFTTKTDNIHGPLHAAIAVLKQKNPPPEKQVPIELKITSGQVLLDDAQIGEVQPLF